jgi:hypothetical protein
MDGWMEGRTEGQTGRHEIRNAHFLSEIYKKSNFLNVTDAEGGKEITFFHSFQKRKT